MKKALIVGSTSIVGKSIARSLAGKFLVSYAGRDEADFKLDLLDTEINFPNNIQFDVIIHAAADFGGNDEDDILRAEKVNALGALTVCRLAKKLSAAHVVLISSFSASYSKECPYFGIYSLSKRHGEELAQLYCNQYQIPLTILRPTQLYDDKSLCRTHQSLFYSIVDKAELGQNVTFFGNNDAVRNYLFLDDFAEVVANVIEKKVVGLFHCPSLESKRLSEIAKEAYLAFNRGGQVCFNEKERDLFDLPVIPDDELYAKINFFPRIYLSEGMMKIKKVRDQK